MADLNLASILQSLRDQFENTDPARQHEVLAAALRTRQIRSILADLQSAMHQTARAPIDEESYRVVLIQRVIRDTVRQRSLLDTDVQKQSVDEHR